MGRGSSKVGDAITRSPIFSLCNSDSECRDLRPKERGGGREGGTEREREVEGERERDVQMYIYDILAF